MADNLMTFMIVSLRRSSCVRFGHWNNSVPMPFYSQNDWLVKTISPYSRPFLMSCGVSNTRYSTRGTLEPLWVVLVGYCIWLDLYHGFHDHRFRGIARRVTWPWVFSRLLQNSHVSLECMDREALSQVGDFVVEEGRETSACWMGLVLGESNLALGAKCPQGMACEYVLHRNRFGGLGRLVWRNL